MKATGVVRRIDDLGRIVIPKEIRRNFKINEGDSIEIFVDNNGIILKKYSILDDLVEVALNLVDVVRKIYGKNIIITDKDNVIASVKELKNNYLGKELTPTIKNKIDNRSEYLSENNSSIIVDNDVNINYFLIPIVANSDSLGSVILIDDVINNDDKNLVRFITSILIKNVEQ